MRVFSKLIQIIKAFALLTLAIGSTGCAYVELVKEMEETQMGRNNLEFNQAAAQSMVKSSDMVSRALMLSWWDQCIASGEDPTEFWFFNCVREKRWQQLCDAMMATGETRCPNFDRASVEDVSF